ncbi:hypothetical protein CGRA01v4_15031 [Colletotrichum graminicola]|nr:hypothetical protein CGRA01v4_15031 [Colletotrichum graminicola]
MRISNAGRWTQAKKLGLCVDIDTIAAVENVLYQVIVACACSRMEWSSEVSFSRTLWCKGWRQVCLVLVKTGPADCEANAQEERDEGLRDVSEQAVEKIKTSREHRFPFLYQQPQQLGVYNLEITTI